MGWHGDHDELALLVSEVVTNALLYTMSDIGVTVYVHDCGIWVSVADNGTGQVILHHAEPSEILTVAASRSSTGSAAPGAS